MSHQDDSPGASARITAEVTGWPGVEAGTGSRGEWSFRLGRREIGHLHGDHVLHIAYPKAIWAALHAEGRIGHHPIFPGQAAGYGARRIDDEADVRDVIALLRLNYDRAAARRRAPQEA